MKIVSNLVNTFNAKKAAKQVDVVADYLGTVAPMQFKKIPITKEQLKTSQAFEKLSRKLEGANVEDMLATQMPQAVKALKDGTLNELVKSQALAKKPSSISELLGKISIKTK